MGLIGRISPIGPMSLISPIGPIGLISPISPICPMKRILTIFAFLHFYIFTSNVVAQTTYQNPVINKSLPDPTVIRAQDNYFYLYATEDTHNVPIYRSKDLVTWRYAGTAFTDATRPMDMVPNGAIWAPDINYFDGHYVLYYSKSEWGKTWENGIGVAVSDRPNGSFKNAHKLFLSSEIGIENCIDPFFIEDDGKKYLFFGSFHDIFGVELSDDGMSLKEDTEPKKIAGGLIEATMIVKHDGWYYLIGSAGSCCEGANSTYRLVMTRSRNLFGPYVDRNGRTAVGDNFSPLLNKSTSVYGPGHCSEFVEDDAGQTWVLYHGFQADDIDAGRVTYLDRIIWGTGGWPTIQSMRPSTEAAVPLFGAEAGIADVSASAADDYLVMPTQSPNMYRIEGPEGETFSWQLFTLNGVTLQQGTGRQTVIVDFGVAQRGMYIIRVEGKSGAHSEKVILN